MKSGKLLENLGIFVETVRAGGFSPVARQRGLVASSVARQIDALETELQVTLFTRSTRSLKPTKAGELLYDRALRILDQLAETRSEVSTFDQEVSGVLQISCLPTFGRRYVIPCLDKLSLEYPSLSVDIDLTERLADPNSERLDAAIRFGDLPDSKLIATRIGTQRYVICASPSYLNRHGLPVRSEDLENHRLIDKRHEASPLGWREVLGRRGSHVSFVLQCDDFEGQRTAALSGMGIARLPDWVVGNDIQTGLLRELRFEDIPPAPTKNISLLRAVPKRSAKLTAFTDCLHRFVGTPPRWLC